MLMFLSYLYFLKPFIALYLENKSSF
jgi:hypothetical protein